MWNYLNNAIAWSSIKVEVISEPLSTIPSADQNKNVKKKHIGYCISVKIRMNVFFHYFLQVSVF